MNFSYFIFKTRPALKAYFARCFANLKRDGRARAGYCFGGGGVHRPNVERTVHPSFTYYWSSSTTTPVYNTAQLRAATSKPKGGRKLKNVFTLRLAHSWTIAEIRELLAEGRAFRRSHRVLGRATTGVTATGKFVAATSTAGTEAVWILDDPRRRK